MFPLITSSSANSGEGRDHVIRHFCFGLARICSRVAKQQRSQSPTAEAGHQLTTAKHKQLKTTRTTKLYRSILYFNTPSNIPNSKVDWRLGEVKQLCEFQSFPHSRSLIGRGGIFPLSPPYPPINSRFKEAPSTPSGSLSLCSNLHVVVI